MEERHSLFLHITANASEEPSGSFHYLTKMVSLLPGKYDERKSRILGLKTTQNLARTEI